MTKNNEKTLEGIIRTTSRGIAFFQHEDLKEDIKVNEGDLNTAMNGDIVTIAPRPKVKNEQQEGSIISIVKREKLKFVGTIREEEGNIYVVPDDKRAYRDFLLQKTNTKLKKRDKVLVAFVEWNDKAENPTAKLLQVIGQKGEHEVEILSIVLEKGIDTTFPEEVEHEAIKAKDTFGRITNDDIAERADFRSTLTFTIDPFDAKDFDDALSIKEVGPDTYQIGIHIADVSHYVRPNTQLNNEALGRGFSSYLVDRTIPMLPEILSNDLCSLNPEEDKLTYSAVFEIDKNAGVTKRWFGKTIIHSDKRFTYEDAQESIDAGGAYSQELITLNTIAKKMRDKRMKDGAIDFDSSEYKFELDKDGVPIKIYRKERLDTHKLVEEFMLLANKEVALFINKSQDVSKEQQKSKPFIYRVHDLPDPEKLEELSLFVTALGHTLDIKNGKVSGKALNRLFEDINGTSEEALIKTAAIRSMAKAVYSTKNVGHFGLGFGFYTHFTSPIRRYADLLVHRLLSKCIAGEKMTPEERVRFARIADDLSRKEMSIVEAERDSIKFKQVEYMSRKIGDEIDGTISGVTQFGIFVADKETGAEGLIHIKKLGGDFYVLDAKHYRLVGERTKKTFRLGDDLKVLVAGANLDRKELDYKIA